MKYTTSFYIAGILIFFSSMAIGDSNTTQDVNKSSNKNVPTEEKSQKEKSPDSTELSMEDQIKKALGGVEQMTVMKASEPKIISESEAKALESKKPKRVKRASKTKDVTRNKKSIKKRIVKKTAVKKRPSKKKIVKKEVNIDDLPMAKTYSMDTDTSTINE